MRSLRTFLVFLIAGTILPGLLFGVGSSWWLAHEMRRTAEHDAQAIAEQTAANVAEHVRLVTAAIKALARSPAVARDDLEEAYAYASMLAQDLGQHIGIATPDGQQLLNTRREFGAALPRRSSSVSYTRALETGKPSVSNIIIGAVTKQPLITIDVPAMSANGPRVVGTSTDLAAVGQVLNVSRFKEGWKAAIVDRDGRFIARSLNPERYLGQLAVPEVIAVAQSDRPSGAFRNLTHEGIELISFFAKVPGTEWTVIIGTPEPVLLAPLDGPLAMLSAAGALAIGLTLAVALTLGRRLDAAAVRLTADAHAMGQGADLPPVSQSIAEFERVEEAFHEAARQSRERQAELERARETAERSVAAKNRFLAAAGHDLCQPLNASSICLQLLGEMALEGQVARYVQRLSQAHASMTSLVGELFDLAKLDADAVVARPSTFALSDLVREVVEECGPAAEAKGLSLRVRVCGDHRIETDRALLRRIVRNLTDNATRYTRSGAVLVACRRRSGKAVVEVWDTGIGIAADKLDLIWDEFYQVGEGGGRQGSGLGLAIVARLAKLLGCSVEVRSRPEVGSVFRVIMPGDVVAEGAA